MKKENPKDKLREALSEMLMEVDSMSDYEAFRMQGRISNFKNKNNLPSVCFTGFGAPEEKESLMELAYQSGFHVSDSVSKSLDFLCCGPNPGPAKIKKAKEQDVPLISPAQFRALIETGEVPG